MARDRRSRDVERGLDRARQRKGGGALLDAVLLALFYASIISAVWFGARTAAAFADTEIYGYHLSDAARDATRREMDRMFAALIPVDADRRAFWNDAVAREVEVGDLSAARGFLLAAPSMLPPGDAAALRASLPPDADDDALVAEAAELLTAPVREAWQRESSLMGTTMRGAGDFVTGAVTGQGRNAGTLAGAVTADFFVIGDIRDLTIQSGRWIAGEEVDVFILSLSAVGLGLTAATIASAGGAGPIKAGASVIKAGKRAGVLSARLTRQLGERVARAIPPARLRRELDTALGPSTPLLRRPAEVAASFGRAADPGAVRALSTKLDDLGVTARAVSPGGTLRLLENVDDAADLRRMRLVAETGGDKAIALSKRMGPGFLRAAKATLKMTRALAFDIAALVSALVGFVASLAFGLVRRLASGALRAHRRRQRAAMEAPDAPPPRRGRAALARQPGAG